MDVAIAILPLVGLFLVFQFTFLKLPGRQVVSILAGSAIAAFGLFTFLLGIGVSLLPFGRLVGTALGAMGKPWISVLAGIVVGFVTAWGEPAVRVLANQVEAASSGSIHKGLVLNTICVGVAICVGLGMFRITYDIPLLYFLVPGYLVTTALMWLSDDDFIAIAVDAGGVATGPLTNSFLLALALGASAAIRGEASVAQGFGMVALVALAPIISVMMLGALIRFTRLTRGKSNGEAVPHR